MEFILCLCVCLLIQMIGCFGGFCFIELDVPLSLSVDCWMFLLFWIVFQSLTVGITRFSLPVLLI